MSVQGVVTRYRSTQCPSIAGLIASEIDLYINDKEFLTLPPKLLFEVFEKCEYMPSDKIVTMFNNIKKYQNLCPQEMLNHFNITFSERRRVERAFCSISDKYSAPGRECPNKVPGDLPAYVPQRCTRYVSSYQPKVAEPVCEPRCPKHCPKKFGVEWDGSKLFIPDIFECCRRKDVEGVMRLLDNDPSLVNARSNAWNGVTPIHYAIDFGDLEMVNVLLARGADVNAKSESGLTPLHLCASRNQLDIARATLLKGARVNDTNCTGETPLHLAATQGHTEMAALLLGHGAFIDPADKYGLSPVFLANFCSRISTANYLYDNGSKAGQEWKRWQSITNN